MADGKIYILFGARYWRVTREQHRALLRERVAGALPSAAEFAERLDLDPILAAKVPERQRARIEWEEGGVRNLDRVQPRVARTWLAEQE